MIKFLGTHTTSKMNRRETVTKRTEAPQSSANNTSIYRKDINQLQYLKEYIHINNLAENRESKVPLLLKLTEQA